MVIRRRLCIPGKFFWRLTRERHLVSLHPAQIQRFWRGLPANLDGLDAVYERPGDHKIVFLKGTHTHTHTQPHSDVQGGKVQNHHTEPSYLLR